MKLKKSYRFKEYDLRSCSFLLKDSAYSSSLGSKLLMTVYKGIAPGGDRKALPSLDVNTRRLADGLLQLSFSISQQVRGCSFLKREHWNSAMLLVSNYMLFACGFLQSEQLVELLLNTIMLSVPISGGHSHNFLSFSHGEYFYSLFQTTINGELLKNLETAVPRLLRASSEKPSMVVHVWFRGRSVLRFPRQSVVWKQKYEYESDLIMFSMLVFPIPPNFFWLVYP